MLQENVASMVSEPKFERVQFVDLICESDVSEDIDVNGNVGKVVSVSTDTEFSDCFSGEDSGPF